MDSYSKNGGITMYRNSIKATIALSLFSASLVFVAGGLNAQAQVDDNTTQMTTIAQDTESREKGTVQDSSANLVAGGQNSTNFDTSQTVKNDGSVIASGSNENSTTNSSQKTSDEVQNSRSVTDAPSESRPETPLSGDTGSTITVTDSQANTENGQKNNESTTTKLPTTSVSSLGDDQEVPTTHQDTHGGIDATVDSTIDLGISDLGSSAQSYDDALSNNTTLQLANSGSDQIVKTSQGNVDAFYNTKSGEMTLLANNKVLVIPKFGSTNITDDNGHVWDVYNLGTGKMGVQDAVDSNIQRTQTASVTESGMNVATSGSLAVANGVNLAADLAESTVAEPINALAYATMIGLGISSAVPVLGIVPLIADGVLIVANSLWHGFQYAWSTVRRSAVLTPVGAGAVAGPVVNGVNAVIRGSNVAVTNSPTDQSLSNEANRQLLGSLAGSATTKIAVGTDAALQAGTFVAHTATEAAFVGAEWALGVMSAVPIIGIIPLIADGVLITAHSAVNAGQRVADEARRAAILGTGGAVAVAGPAVNAAHSVILNSQAQKHNYDTYTWNLK
ncbi:hypothetical protein [Secundilactobacillus kimchicus]|uniref:hypothetical protein n=1 Tax=Secundilactobacillus kimchicus TaxID=528209 RepID=UPI0024A8CC6B|nr:hypothetical protein [Secundilactobacillus kimchicus]